jgi:hypothetical protein
VFLVVVARRLGQWQIWLVCLMLLAYSITVSVYAMTRNLGIRFCDPSLTRLVILFILTAAFLEEVSFRG